MKRTWILISLLALSGCDHKQSPGQLPDTTAKRILGVSLSNTMMGFNPQSNPNYEVIKRAGIGWVRLGFAFPFRDKVGGEFTEQFTRDLEEARRISKLGLRIMGGTPTPGDLQYDIKNRRTAWLNAMPEWAGTVDSDRYYETYQKACEEIGRQTKGIIDLWQVSNEMDLTEFRGSLSVQQAVRFLNAGARGLKNGNPDAKADVNPASAFFEGEEILRALYGSPDSPFDFVGIDGYFGSFAPGGPAAWIEVIDRLHEITHKPVLINEWGYSSLEGSGRPLKRKVGNEVCDRQLWDRAWRKQHSPEEQAEYVRLALKIFATYPDVAGCFFYEWNDDPLCSYCGSVGCPNDCGWGLVDVHGNPKPAYYAFQAMAREYFQ